MVRRAWLFMRRDAGLKIISVSLALIVWYNAGTKQSVEYNIRIPLEVRNLPSQFVLVGDIPESARIRVRGKGKFFKFRMKEVMASIDASEAEPGLFLRPLTVQDVVLPPGSDAEIREVLAPRMVRAEVDRKVRRRVPVEPVLAGSPPQGYTTVGSPRVSPDSVDLVGPERFIGSLSTARLEDLELSRVRGEVNVKRRVDISGTQSIEAIPAEAQVTITVERVTEIELATVPVHVRSAGRNEVVSVTPNVVSVRLSGPASLLTSVSADTLALLIEGAGLTPGNHNFRTDLVGANRVLLLPVDASEGSGSESAARTGYRAARLAIPPAIHIVEIVPSHFSIVVERPGALRRPS